jgi:hypothetical protein
MNGCSERYAHHLECQPDRFDSNELVRRYQAGEFLYFQERKDAERIIRIRAEQAEKRNEIAAIVLPIVAELAAVGLFMACGAVWAHFLTRGI